MAVRSYPAVLTGGPHDGLAMELPLNAEAVSKFDEDGKLHAYVRTGIVVDGIVVYEHAGEQVGEW